MHWHCTAHFFIDNEQLAMKKIQSGRRRICRTTASITSITVWTMAEDGTLFNRFLNGIATQLNCPNCDSCDLFD
jgi:hypothetical protein